MKKCSTSKILPIVIATTWALVTSAQADLINFGITTAIYFQQVDANAPTIPSNYAINFVVSEQSLGDFTSAAVTYPGPSSPQPLGPFASFVPGGAGNASFGTNVQLYTTATDFHNAYPFGTYTAIATNSVTSDTQSTSIQYSSDTVTPTIPGLAAASYNQLQGLNPTQSITITFAAPLVFSPGASPIFDMFAVAAVTPGMPAQLAFIQNLIAGATSITLPANTLLPSTNYIFALDFGQFFANNDERISTALTFVQDTSGQFTTGAATAAPVPEPNSILVVATGLLLMCVVSLRRRQKLVDPLARSRSARLHRG